MTDAAERSVPESAEAMTVERAGDLARAVVDNVAGVIVGNGEAIEHLVAGLLGGGHVLIEDVPGVGKTMLARAVAASLECSFKRVQFTADLLPADVTGANVYNRTTESFEFRRGPIFANIVLGDEINRAPPKTQAALLEAMEEGQVTVDGRTHAVPEPFAVIATQNSVERERTYELPAAELDRFMLKLSLGYPDEEGESRVIDRAVGGHAVEDVEPVASTAAFGAARETTAGVEVSEPVRDYVARLAAYTRDHAALGVSPRGSISLAAAAQGRAILDSRGYVLPDDVQAAAPAVLPHRMRTAEGPEGAAETVAEALAAVPVEK
jgi:MoxR-like ATPase